jgi:serine kinase of HPr protein (carbohydrate metabolism regulator)
VIRQHATCIAISGRGVLLCGASGCGKSDLALRLIDRGARLVSDDYTELSVVEGRLIATAPDTITGKLEVRGIGIIEFANVSDIPIALCVGLDQPPQRLPLEQSYETILGVMIPKYFLAPLEPSAPIKLEMLLASQSGNTG